MNVTKLFWAVSDVFHPPTSLYNIIIDKKNDKMSAIFGKKLHYADLTKLEGSVSNSNNVFQIKIKKQELIVWGVDYNQHRGSYEVKLY